MLLSLPWGSPGRRRPSQVVVVAVAVLRLRALLWTAQSAEPAAFTVVAVAVAVPQGQAELRSPAQGELALPGL